MNREDTKPEDRELLRHPAVGGVILFTRNYGDTEQVTALTDAIHQLRDPHLLVAVDQEGGRVQRFRDGFTRLPPPGCLGKILDQDRKRALHLAEVTGWLMAAEMRAVGIDISFAPVLDLARNPLWPRFYETFGEDPFMCGEMGSTFIRSYASANPGSPYRGITCGKHFVGYSDPRSGWDRTPAEIPSQVLSSSEVSW